MNCMSFIETKHVQLSSVTQTAYDAKKWLRESPKRPHQNIDTGLSVTGVHANGTAPIYVLKTTLL